MDQESSYQSLYWSDRAEQESDSEPRRETFNLAHAQAWGVPAGGVGHRRSVVAVDDVRVPAGRAYVAEHEEHQCDHHRQQEPLGVKDAGGVTSAVVVAAVAPHAAARPRSHGGGRASSMERSRRRAS